MDDDYLAQEQSSEDGNRFLSDQLGDTLTINWNYRRSLGVLNYKS